MSANMPWSELRRISRNGAFRWSPLWLFIVPLAAKTLEHVPRSVEMLIYGASVPLTIALPFSSLCLFLSALMLTIGNLVFAWKCPPLVRNYEDFSGFDNAGMGIEQLRRIWISHKWQPLLGGGLDVSSGTLERFNIAVRLGDAQTRQEVLDEFTEQPMPGIDERTLKECFWGFHARFDVSRTRWRLLCALCYSVGLLALGIVVGQNVIFVVRHLPW